MSYTNEIKITKHVSRSNEVHLHCDHCGCEFTAPVDWCTGRPKRTVTVAIAGQGSPGYWYDCPECGHEAHD